MKWLDPYVPAVIPEAEQTDTISVVTAVYNIEPYLAACLDSLLAQTYRNLEIILVDDGSTDGSPAILDRYAAADPRIRILRKTNGGPGSARNAGMKLCTGKYLTFLDGDDTLDPDAYMRAVSALRENSAQIAVYRYRQITAAGVLDASKERAAVFEGDELLTAYLEEGGTYCIQNAPWNKFFVRSLADGLSFDESRRYEDILFTTKLFARNPKAVYLDHSSYSYVSDRGGSLMNGGEGWAEESGRETVRPVGTEGREMKEAPADILPEADMAGGTPGRISSGKKAAPFAAPLAQTILSEQIPIYRERAAFLSEIGREDLRAIQDYYFIKRMLLYVLQNHRSSDPSALKKEKAAQLCKDILAERDRYDAAFASPVAARGQLVRLKLYVFSPAVFVVAMGINDNVILPLRQSLRKRRKNGS